MTDELIDTENLSQLSHDLKNTMTSVNAYGQLIKRRLDKGEMEQGRLMVEKLNDQLSKLAKELVTYTEAVKALKKAHK